MSVTAEISHGKPRARGLRKDRVPKTPAALAAAPHQDPATGRWLPGNPGSRLRQIAAIGRHEAESLLRLAAADVAPFLRGHLVTSQTYCQELVDGLPAHTAELVALCGDEAKARLMASACMTEGAREGCTAAQARAWREEARSWLREVRQIVLTRKALERGTEPDPSEDDTPWLKRRPALAPATPKTTRTSSETESRSDGQPEGSNGQSLGTGSNTSSMPGEPTE